MGSSYKTLQFHAKVLWLSQEKANKLIDLFMEHSFYLKESLKDKLQLFILRSFADIFSNEQSEPIISRKAADIVFCYNVKIQDFKLK